MIRRAHAVTARLTLLTLGVLGGAAPAGARVLTLTDAVQNAIDHQPQIRLVHANTDAAKARANEARAPILPQLVGTATYLRETANYAPRPGAIPTTVCAAGSTTCTSTMSSGVSYSDTNYNYFNFGLTLSQYVWDFGLTTNRWKASKEIAVSTADTEAYVRIQILLNVRVAYFAARADAELLGVAQETLNNQSSHLKQIDAQVQVGTRPQIDYIQAKASVANARYQLISSQNVLANAKVALNQAMGIEGPVDYDLDLDTVAQVAGEDGELDPLVDEAAHNRQDLRSLEDQIAAQRLTLSSAKGAYGPSLSVNASLTDAGIDISKLAWNWAVGATAQWSLFSGLLTYSQVQEQRANLVAIQAQRDALHQQVYADVEQARLSVLGAKSSIQAADEALDNSKEQLRLAEQRYAQGLGNIVELSDAQLQLTSTAAQKTQAVFNLALARAQLLRALGRVA